MSSEHLLAALFPGLTVLELQTQVGITVLIARAAQATACCPRCAVPSNRVHSYYTRQPRDLPMVGHALRLVLHVRRWRCLNADCPSKTFSEPLPELLAPAAQRTRRLNAALQQLALALGGEAGARQSLRQGMPASADTLLRCTRQVALPNAVTPRVLAVDDFAFRKGRSYGTILGDAESHRPVDLLPERSAASFAAWLRQHPGIEIITRDRATEYARGATDGAPQALQVLDRWHLIGNLQEALARLLDRIRARLQQLLATTPVLADASARAPLSIYDRHKRRGTLDQQRQQDSRARRYQVYAQVKRLYEQGRNILQIAHELDIARQTVRRYIASPYFPEYSAKPRRASKLDPYVAYLQQRWDAGCRANKQLYAGLQEQGYQGSIRPLVQWTMLRREQEGGKRPASGRKEARQVTVFQAALTAPELAAGTTKLPGAQSLSWLLMADAPSLSAEQRQLLQQMQQDKETRKAHKLGQQFLRMICERQEEELAAWLERCVGSGIAELATFAVGLQREALHVRAAIRSPYSNGVAEGNVTRLKQIRRAMYGRGNFDLLKIRVLVAA